MVSSEELGEGEASQERQFSGAQRLEQSQQRVEKGQGKPQDTELGEQVGGSCCEEQAMGHLRPGNQAGLCLGPTKRGPVQSCGGESRGKIQLSGKGRFQPDLLLGVSHCRLFFSKCHHGASGILQLCSVQPRCPQRERISLPDQLTRSLVLLMYSHTQATPVVAVRLLCPVGARTASNCEKQRFPENW